MRDDHTARRVETAVHEKDTRRQDVRAMRRACCLPTLQSSSDGHAERPKENLADSTSSLLHTASHSRLDCFRLINIARGQGTRPQSATCCEPSLMYNSVRWCELGVFSFFFFPRGASSSANRKPFQVRKLLCTRVYMYYTAPGVDKPPREESRAGRIRSRTCRPATR